MVMVINLLLLLPLKTDLLLLSIRTREVGLLRVGGVQYTLPLGVMHAMWVCLV
jgi:hypothetical protein